MSRLKQFVSPYNESFVLILTTTVESLLADRIDAERIIAITDVAATKPEETELSEMFASVIGSSSLSIPVEVEVLPPPRRSSLSDDDLDQPRPPTPPPSDADDGEPEIEAEFRQNLSHLMGRGADFDEEVDGENVRLSMIVEENLDLSVVGSVS
jgi:hypothetical protein